MSLCRTRSGPRLLGQQCRGIACPGQRRECVVRKMMSYVRCALVCAITAEVSLSPDGLDLFPDLPVQAGIKVRDRSVVDHCELQGCGKAREEFAGLVLRN